MEPTGEDHDGVSFYEREQLAKAAGDRFERLVDQALAAELETGRKEKTVEQARRNIFRRVGTLILGSVVLLLGIVLLILPGPGLVIVAAGLYLIALEVPFAARLLDRVKKRLPQDEDGKLPKSAIVMMVVMTVGATGASIAWAVIK